MCIEFDCSPSWLSNSLVSLYGESSVLRRRWEIDMWWRILQTTRWIYCDISIVKSSFIFKTSVKVTLPKKSTFLRGFEKFGTPSPITFYHVHFNSSNCMLEDLFDNGARRNIGGVGCIVEIDESKFGKRKYNRSRRVVGKWVLGGFCRTILRRLLFSGVYRQSTRSQHPNHTHQGARSTG